MSLESSNRTTPTRHSVLAQLQALGPAEHQLIRQCPRARRELWIQVAAQTLVGASLSYAIFELARNLLGYAAGGALLITVLFLSPYIFLNHHLIVQTRGTHEEDRLSVAITRALSIAITGISFFLLVAKPFAADIDTLIAKTEARYRAQIAASPAFASDLEIARRNLSLALSNAARQAALTTTIARLQLEKARAHEGYINQCDGAVTIHAGQVQRRIKGCGPIAAGYHNRELRLAAQIAVARQEGKALGNPAQRVAAIQQRLAQIRSTIDRKAQAGIGGAAKRMDALFRLLASDPGADFTASVFALLGLGAELLLYFAQVKRFNRARFMEALAIESTQERIALRRTLNDQLEPIEVDITGLPLSAAYDPDRQNQAEEGLTATFHMNSGSETAGQSTGSLKELH